MGMVLCYTLVRQDKTILRIDGGGNITEVTVQHAPFAKPHCVLIMAFAIVLLIYGRSADLDISRRIFMQA